MTTITNIRHTLQLGTSRVLGVSALALMVLFTLFAFEAAPMRGGTSEAMAWHCSISAVSVTTDHGTDVTLTWDAASDVDYVTIDYFGDQQFAQDGTVEVTITETTTFTAYTHVGWTDDTLQCKTTVTVEDVPADPCDAVDFSYDDTSFTWDGSPKLEEYTVGFCDGSSTGIQYVCEPDETWYEFDARISSIVVSGGACHKEVHLDCPPEEEEPEWPVCPFSDDEDTTVVYFDGKGLISNETADDARSNPYDLALSAGTYEIETASWDGYLYRVNVSQQNEQWYMELLQDTSVFATTRATTDLEDYVVESLVVETLEPSFVLSEAVDTMYAVHAVYPDTSSRNSVQPICAAFTKEVIVEEPAPTCAASATPTSIFEGDTSTLTWSSNDASTVIWDGIASTELNGTASVSPTETTTYTGTFTGARGDTVACSATVEVKDIPDEPTPFCSMSASPSTITEGGAAVISWQSNNTTDVVFTGLTSIDLTGTATVTPTTTTTYTGVFTGTDGSTTTCSAVLTVEDEPVVEAPVCSMSVSDSLVPAGTTVSLNWTSDNASVRSIDQQIGTVSATGSVDVVINNRITYTGTFANDDGDSVTCSATASVETGGGGGGGGCINCGDDDDDDDPKDDEEDEPSDEPNPSIVLSKTVKGASNSITLAQVPYTGFDASPMVTALFWIAVLGISVALAYMVTAAKNNAHRAYAHAAVAPVQLAEYKAPEFDLVAPTTDTSLMQQNGSMNDSSSLIEELAHKDNILLSPEATRMISTAAAQADIAAPDYLTQLFDVVKATYPREDGWILLSKERTEQLLAQNGSAPAPQAAAPSTAAPTPTPAPTVAPAPAARTARTEAAPAQGNGNVVATFVQNLVSGEQQKTFELLRTMNAKGIDTGAFIGRVVRDLDEVYKHRLEGNHTPDASLAQLTASWQPQDFEQVLGILVECIDYSYTNTRIGTKVALAKVFEHFAK